jgi:ribosomal protein S18 acetylase RimI-like enzyme
MPRRSDVDLLAMAERQSEAFLRAAANRPWASIRIDDDVVHGTSGIPIPAFNGATGARFTAATADARIEDVLRPFREQRIDMTWWVGSLSRPPDLTERLLHHGLTVDERSPVLALDLDGWTAPPLPPGLEPELVVDAAGFHRAMEIMFAGFEMPVELLPLVEERYADYSLGPQATQRVQLVRLDGRPVSTALGFILDGVVGIYNVATLPEARRRGAGAAATAAAIGLAKGDGATHAILETSAMGRSVYEGLGFREVGSITVLLGSFGSAHQGTG